jgi:hypothetical protein
MEKSEEMRQTGSCYWREEGEKEEFMKKKVRQTRGETEKYVREINRR